MARRMRETRQTAVAFPRSQLASKSLVCHAAFITACTADCHPIFTHGPDTHLSTTQTQPTQVSMDCPEVLFEDARFGWPCFARTIAKKRHIVCSIAGASEAILAQAV